MMPFLESFGQVNEERGDGNLSILDDFTEMRKLDSKPNSVYLVR